LPSGWWQRLALILVIVLLPLFIMGVGDEIVRVAVLGPLAVVLNTLSSVLIVVIVFDFLGIVILATIEAIIERVTGASATFSKGKMTVMTREEAIAYRRSKRDRERQQQQKRKAARTAAKAGPPTVYRLTLPIPGPPGSEPVTHRPDGIIEPGQADVPALQASAWPPRLEPSVVPGLASRKPVDVRQIEDKEIEISAVSHTREALPTPSQSDENREKDDLRGIDEDTPSKVTLSASVSPRPMPAPAARPPSEDKPMKKDLDARLEAFRARNQSTVAPSDDVDAAADLDDLRYEDLDDLP
jgi:hypothetical protein